MWKIHEGLSPNDLLISFSEGSARLGLAALPPLLKSSRAASQSLYDHSFAVVGPKLWNILPASIRNEIQSLHLKPQSTASAHVILTLLHYVASLLLKMATPY